MQLSTSSEISAAVGRPALAPFVATVLEVLPAWVEDTPANDMYYWYYGTYAMYQTGGESWAKWNAALKEALMPSQHKKGPMQGSWDPIGPWGYAGGRVYSTAILALTLEVYYRFPRR